MVFELKELFDNLESIQTDEEAFGGKYLFFEENYFCIYKEPYDFFEANDEYSGIPAESDIHKDGVIIDASYLDLINNKESSDDLYMVYRIETSGVISLLKEHTGTFKKDTEVSSFEELMEFFHKLFLEWKAKK